ncbi:Krueppel c2h2-type zinc finger protein [Penicillium malachiteum]|uniref:Krueppel c2h2-type zinc finger protein n=1 Tax=Penicillium malachiteum TaxID=1324776 RepID=UPI0025470A4F|nr:Krueppel c2h2-type zinc finger protein [Penicillium malachiteum]KAJ5730685.1 Krueppel c2h2-type zinc finger protein [Penicillium malachiteum]
MGRDYKCTEPGCGKGFLRPEHLSRHRLNHRPKQIYQCPNCPKRFVRNDLLRRHQKRHERGMWFRNSGGIVPSDLCQIEERRPSQEARSSDSDSIIRADMRDASVTPNSYENHNDEPDNLKVPSTAPPIDHNSLPGSLHHMVDANTESNVTSLFWDPSFSAPDPLLDFDWLFDDMSNFNTGDATLSSEVISPARTGISDMSPPSFPMGSQGIRLSVASNPSSFAPWSIVQGRLFEALTTLPQNILTSPFFLPSSLSHFFDLYFQNYHPHFPILHQPTLDPTQAPPLLIAAIVTLGSTLSCEEGHFQTSVQIHDSLRYIIFNSPDFEPPASLWCVQTLLLIQAHEKMFSTRKHHQLAHIFHGAIITLMKRGVSYHSSYQGLDDLQLSWRQWVEIQSSNRTAFFGFVMDAQHSFMFGHTCILSVQDVRLPLPCPDYLWECGDVLEWDRMIRKSPEPPGFLPVLKKLIARTPIPPQCTAYGRLILLHGLFSVTAHLKARDSVTLGVGGALPDRTRQSTVDSWKDTLEKAMDTWSFCLVSRSSSLALEASKPLHRMAYVAIYTDITDMHILAGAPSLLGNMLSEADLVGATARVQTWSERPEAKRALYHCLLLIQEILFTGKPYHASQDNLSLRPWSLYHAALILWAYGFMEGRRNPCQEKEISYTAEEYLVRMLMLIRNEEDIGIASQQTSELLSAVRDSLIGCRWELLQEAYGTLGRLIDSS